jgi:hypothetical protein
MNRPGCVWSHVLLIRIEDIVYIRDAAELVALFKDPRRTDRRQYVAPIEFPRRSALSQGFGGVFTDPYPDDPEILLCLLYERPEKSIIIPANNSNSYEPLVLEVWSQQWPALRSAFRFCTGSLSNRTIGGEPFDLQVVPFGLSHELQRSPDVFELLPDANRQSLIPNMEHWSRLAVRDLEAGTGGGFRQFLWKYADPCAGQRSLYTKMAYLFADLEQSRNETPEMSHITQQVTSIFSEKTCGTALKQYLYGDTTDSELPQPFTNEVARLTELATTPFWSSFDASQLHLRARGHKLWNQEKNEAKNLLLNLLQKPKQPLADTIIAGFAEAMRASEVCQLAHTDSELLLALVSRNPHLVVADDFWHCDLLAQTYDKIFDFLQTNEATKQVPPKTWISAVLKSRADEFAFPIVERFGSEAVRACFERVENVVDSNWIPPAEWCAALRNRQQLLIDFLKDTGRGPSRVMALLAGLLDAHDPALIKLGLGPWLELVREAPEVVRDFPQADAATFLLSLGFQHSGLEAVELVKISFEIVHAAASQDRLSSRGWGILKEDVPMVSWMRKWDKCEQLRQALLQRFIWNRWPQEALLECIHRPETLRGVLHSARDVRDGEHFIRSIAEKVFSGALHASQEQRTVFEASFRRNRHGELVLDI